MTRIRRPAALAALCSVLAAAHPGLAGQTGRSGAGGGFIEQLMSGGDPAPRSHAPDAPGAAPAALPEALPGWRTATVPPLPPAPDGGIEAAFDPRFARQEVQYEGPYPPGTVVIDTPAKFLYLVQPGGTALRYGIGVGRPGFTWAGEKTVTRKAQWPDWIPPEEMLQRRPDLPRFVAGGPQNPLGARALYLGSSLYRIHGTNEPETIGHNVSSGCIRLRNEDVIDLYERVPLGARVVVL